MSLTLYLFRNTARASSTTNCSRKASIASTMHPTRPLRRKKNLLLAFDAFGTLFHPKQPIPKQYGHFAEKYGIDHTNSQYNIKDTFKDAFKDESHKNPNYGKATGLGAEKWWANVK